MLTYRNTEGECKLYSNLANGEGVPVWHPTDAKMFRRKWVGLPSTSMLKGWGGTGTERSLATPTGVGVRLSHEAMNPGTGETDEAPLGDSGGTAGLRDPRRRCPHADQRPQLRQRELRP